MIQKKKWSVPQLSKKHFFWYLAKYIFGHHHYVTQGPPVHIEHIFWFHESEMHMTFYNCDLSSCKIHLHKNHLVNMKSVEDPLEICNFWNSINNYLHHIPPRQGIHIFNYLPILGTRCILHQFINISSFISHHQYLLHHNMMKWKL